MTPNVGWSSVGEKGLKFLAMVPVAPLKIVIWLLPAPAPVADPPLEHPVTARAVAARTAPRARLSRGLVRCEVGSICRPFIVIVPGPRAARAAVSEGWFRDKYLNALVCSGHCYDTLLTKSRK